MTSLTRLGGCAALCAGLMSAPAATAGSTTGYVSALSEYVYRGVVAEGGAALHALVHHHADNGLFGGLFAANANQFGGSEFDVYAGYAHTFNEHVVLEGGALYYFLTEAKEDLTLNPGRRNLDTLEAYLALHAGPVQLDFYYSPDYFATRSEAYYYSATVSHDVGELFSVALQAGYTEGNGAIALYGDRYVDYSLTASRVIDEGLTLSLAFIGTDLEGGPLFPGTRDDPKAVVSLQKDFAF